jgi:hypothetical protein
VSTRLSSGLGVYEPGEDITGAATAAVTGKTFLAISGDRDVEGSLSVAPATTGGRIVGVAKNTAPTGGLVGISRGGGRVVYVTTSAAVTAFAEVSVGAGATAVPKGSGVAVGYALTGAASGADAEISLY